MISARMSARRAAVALLVKALPFRTRFRSAGAITHQAIPYSLLLRFQSVPVIHDGLEPRLRAAGRGGRNAFVLLVCCRKQQGQLQLDCLIVLGINLS